MSLKNTTDLTLGSLTTKSPAFEDNLDTQPVDSPELPPSSDKRRFRDGWQTVAGAWLLVFNVIGTCTAYGVFQDFYSTVWLKEYTSSDISWIGSVQLFLPFALAPIWGKLYDRGHLRLIVAAGSLLFVFSFFMLSLTQPSHYYQVFLAQAMGMGLGGSLIYLPISTAVGQHFKEHRALAMGIMVSGGAIGGIVFSIMLNQLVHGRLGFAWGVRASAFLSLGCAIIANLLIVTPRGTRISALQTSPSQSSCPPAKLWDVPYSLMLITGFMTALGNYFPTFYLQQYAQMHDINQSLAFYSLAILNASNILGRIIPNYLGDRFGSIDVYIVGLALNGGVCFIMLACGYPAGLVVFAILYGFFFGATTSLYLPVVVSLNTNRVNMGKRLGLSFFPVGLAYLVGPPIEGAIMGPHYVWWKSITFASVTMIAAVGAMILVKFTHESRMRQRSEV